ncbi:MAG: ATP-binding protein, partial [Burkholderiales bacterium]|nr:ATP-binding protein [Burkholderiales bacterium]
NSLPFIGFFPRNLVRPKHKLAKISIGEIEMPKTQLRIQFGMLLTEEFAGDGSDKNLGGTKRRLLKESEAEKFPDGDIRPVLAIRNDQTDLEYIYLTRANTRQISLRKAHYSCAFIPTGFVSMDELAAIWDRIGLTEDKGIIHAAMKLIAPEFEELMFVKKPGKAIVHLQEIERTAIVKLAELEYPIPINSMGDGMSRILQLSLKMFAAKGGFLLIDEFENGLHYSVQEKVWEMVFAMAEKLNMQVFATTHSWDCVESFAKVARNRPQDDGMLLRVGRSRRTSDNGKITSTVLNGQQLFDLTQADMEVR